MKRIVVTLTCLLSILHVIAQNDVYHSSVEMRAGYTSNKIVPFWMRSNQYGSIPLAGASGSIIANGYKDYDSSSEHLFDWGAGSEIRLNVGTTTNVTIIEGYLKARLAMFELKGGRFKETMGLTGDTNLTSGAFSVSGNALGIPKIQLAIPEYANIFGGELFAFKGNFAHGWLGDIPKKRINSSVNGYFHQSSLYGRIGKPDWRVKFYGGVNHNVYWDHRPEADDYNLSSFKEFEYVVLGKVYHKTKVGNHLGSADLGLEYDWDNMSLLVYRQNIYDKGALGHLANMRDGLNGITLTNLSEESHTVQWKKVLLEVLYTKNQAGEVWSKETDSGEENYYNGIYAEGWSYKGLNLGNPFITSRSSSTRDDLPGNRYFFNNRVLAFHVGLAGTISDINISSKLSYSQNYGTYETGGVPYRTSFGAVVTPRGELFGTVHQFSGLISAYKAFDNGLQISAEGAVDIGKLYYNSVGLSIGVRKNF